jgi:serine phosphatase RsbU (regulator of sigma subunit)
MPAALLMARVLAEERYCLLAERTPAEALTRLNRQLTGSIPESRFVTCALLVLDLESHQAVLANAGHLPPLLRRRDGRVVERLGASDSNIPLGIDFDITYCETEFNLEEGDVVVMFTDGLTEARSPSADLYLLRRLTDAVAAGRNQVDAVGEAVLEDVRRFVAGGQWSDDLTLICLGRDT